MYIFELIHQVLDKYKGLAVRLSEKTGISDTYYRSHGYKPKTLDAFGNGNKCPEVENYFDFVEFYEAGAKGAGQMLNLLVFTELKCRFSSFADDCTQRELRRIGLQQATEAIQALDKCDFKDASRNDLDVMSRELSDVAEWLHRAQERVHREIDKREVRQDFAPASNGKAKVY